MIEGAEVLSFLYYVGLALMVALGGLALRALFQRKSVPSPSPEPYECGESPIGTAYSPFLWQYMRLVVLLLVLEAEVVLALPWVWVHRTLPQALFWVELGILGLPLVGVYLYALRSGWLTFSPPPKMKPPLPPLYRQLNAYLASQGQAPSSYFSHPGEGAPPPSLCEKAAPQTPAAAAPQTPDVQYSDPGKTQSP